jgi:hypothetical protein
MTVAILIKKYRDQLNEETKKLEETNIEYRHYMQIESKENGYDLGRHLRYGTAVGDMEKKIEWLTDIIIDLESI